ncbi:unnamed protein product [Rhizophagus irregularis]|nr:unnamed protein product [Rhizophagus irregularis]
MAKRIENANRIFDEKSGTLSRKLGNNSTESRFTTINCKHNVLKRDEVHDGCFSSLQSTNEQRGGKIESTKYADVESGIRYKKCPNKRSIAILQAKFGKLFRTGALGGNAWTTAETLSETCRLVHAHHFPTQDCYGRVFVWEDEGQMVFPLGNSPEEASKRSTTKEEDELAWFVENGNVYEYIKKPQP